MLDRVPSADDRQWAREGACTLASAQDQQRRWRHRLPVQGRAHDAAGRVLDHLVLRGLDLWLVSYRKNNTAARNYLLLLVCT